MGFLPSLFGSSSSVTPQPQASLSKFFNLNNAPVNSFCATIPILQPSLISTTFGQSLLSLFVLSIYFVLYKTQAGRTGVESRLLASFIFGNILFSWLTFNDWFNLRHQIVFCNEYKNGVLNLYQVSELIEAYRFTNLVAAHASFTKEMASKYSVLVYRQFVNFVVECGTTAYDLVQEWINSH